MPYCSRKADQGYSNYPTDDSREGIAKYLKRNQTSGFVAEEDGKIIGVITAGHDGRRGYIHHTAVLPDHKNRGIAKKLINLVYRNKNIHELRRIDT